MAAVSARGMAWQGGNRRALEYAIAASLALHAIALLSLPALPSTAARPVTAQPPLEARLVPEPRVEAPKPPPPPAVEPKREPPQAQRPARTTPRPVPKPTLKKPRPAAPAPRAAAVEPQPSEPPVRVTPPAPAAAATAPPPVAAAAAARAAPAPDAVSLVARYRAAIIEQAKRYKQYPRFARDNGWEGRVNVHLAIAPGGAIASLRVTHGTGFQILDDQALEMVRSATQDVAIPDALRGRSYGVDIPVVFNLRDADG